MPKLLALALLCVLSAGCGLFVQQPQSVKDCWDEADDQAKARIKAECEPSQTMAECPAWPDIEAELKANQENCK